MGRHASSSYPYYMHVYIHAYIHTLRTKIAYASKIPVRHGASHELILYILYACIHTCIHTYIANKDSVCKRNTCKAWGFTRAMSKSCRNLFSSKLDTPIDRTLPWLIIMCHLCAQLYSYIHTLLVWIDSISHFSAVFVGILFASLCHYVKISHVYAYTLHFDMLAK